MSERLYELGYQRTKKPMFVKDIGNVLRLSGIVLQGGGESVIVMFPDSATLLDDAEVINPDDRTLSAIVDACDDPQYYDERSKIWVRKSQRYISGKVQQIIWVRDGLKCMYCGRRMGEVQLTVDHFYPLEMGGANDESNYLSACSRCNHEKSNMSPRDWCEIKGLSFKKLDKYLRERKG